MYIDGYPICVTPSRIETVGIMLPEPFEAGLHTVVKADDHVWKLWRDTWREVDPGVNPEAYREFSEQYDDFEREHLESTMIQSGELVEPLAGGAL